MTTRGSHTLHLLQQAHIWWPSVNDMLSLSTHVYKGRVISTSRQKHMTGEVEPDAPIHKQLVAQLIMVASGQSDVSQLLSLWCSATRIFLTVLMQPSSVEPLAVYVKVETPGGRTGHASLQKPACKHGAVRLNSYSMLWLACYANYRKKSDKLKSHFPLSDSIHYQACVC